MFDVNDPRLTAYVLGELDDADRAAVEAALAESRELRDEVAAIRQTSTLLEGLADEPCPALTPDQRAAIDAAAAVSPAATPTRPWKTFAAVAVAAALLVAVAMGWPEVQKLWETGREARQLARAAQKYHASSEEQSATAATAPDATTRSNALASGGEFVELDTGLGAAGEPLPFDPAANTGGGGGLPGEEHGWAGGGAPTRQQGGFSGLENAPGGLGGDGRGYGDAGLGGGGMGGAAATEGGSAGYGIANPRQPATTASEEASPGGLDLSAPNDALAAGLEGDRPARPVVTSIVPSTDPLPSAGEGDAGDGDDSKALGDNLSGKNPADATGTWRRSAVGQNTSRLVVGERDRLPMEAVQANVVIDGFRARVILDYYFYNNHPQQLEGSFQLRLPNEAALYYFAFGQTSFRYQPNVDHVASLGFLPPELLRSSGTGPAELLSVRESSWSQVKEARVVPKEKAAQAYSEVVRQRIDPALVEWSGAGIFQTKVYPLMPNQLHRIVVGYDVDLVRDGDDLVFRLEMPEGVEESSVDLNVAAMPGLAAQVAPEALPFTSGGRAYYHFKNPSEASIEFRQTVEGTMMLSGPDGAGDFFATRVTAELPAADTGTAAPNAVFLVDTSLSSKPDRFNIWLDLFDSVLERNRDSLQHFAVLVFNVENHWWQPKYVANTPENVAAARAFLNTLSLEGATDLRSALAEAAAPSWANEDRVDARPDLFLLSDAVVTWGDANVHALASAVRSGNGGTLFTYSTGLAGTATDVLTHLARESGGRVIPVVGEQEIAAASTAHRLRPWTLVDATIDGGQDLLIAGRVRSIYPGQSLLLVGRGRPQGEVMLRVKQGDELRDVVIPVDRRIDSPLASRLYGQVAVEQLEELGDAVRPTAISFARHFRIPRQTCSLLMLDSEADYQRFDIQPADDVAVVAAHSVSRTMLEQLDALAEALENPKQMMLAWLDRLQQLPGVTLSLPAEIRAKVEALPDKSFDVALPRLVCLERTRAGQPETYDAQLDTDQLDYDVVWTEAVRRQDEYGSADALKALSSLVEAHPGDPIVLRDVAFSAIEWGMPGQAYPLLRRVAEARPFEPQIYPAIAACLAELDQIDLAIVFYELALANPWHARYGEFDRIAAVEYLDLLHQVAAGQRATALAEIAGRRLEELVNRYQVDEADLVITMSWNTDRTDVDLHVVEPSGEECFYKNPRTNTGGRITRDVTEGYGPEMYLLRRARNGQYGIKANYFLSDRNRTQVRTKVYVTIYENFGRDDRLRTRHTVSLSDGREKRLITSVKVDQ